MPFIKLSMILKNQKPRYQPRPEGKSFGEWRVGDQIVSKSAIDRSVWTIASIDGSTSEEATMGYNRQVYLTTASGEDKQLKGSTLQTGYAGVVPEPGEVKPEVDTKPIAFNTDLIRNFYPRKNDQPGTRIIVNNGIAYIVAESFEQVLGMIPDAATLAPSNE